MVEYVFAYITGQKWPVPSVLHDILLSFVSTGWRTTSSQPVFLLWNQRSSLVAFMYSGTDQQGSMDLERLQLGRSTIVARMNLIVKILIILRAVNEKQRHFPAAPTVTYLQIMCCTIVHRLEQECPGLL